MVDHRVYSSHILYNVIKMLTLILCALATVQVHALNFDCSTMLSNTALDWGSDTRIDEVFEQYQPRNQDEFTSVGAEVQMYVPKYWRTSPHPEAPADTPEIIAEGIRKTIETMNPYFAPMPICVALSPSVHGQGEESSDWHPLYLADTATHTACEVVMYITGVLPLPKADRHGARGGVVPDPDEDNQRHGVQDANSIKATIAHEVFHCYQMWYFESQSVSNRIYESASWWVESTAQYVAQQIYPCTYESRLYAKRYRPTKRLYHQRGGYPSMIFFQHLKEKYSFDYARLKDLMSLMPTQSGMARQREALSALAGISNQFHSFGQAFSDRAFTECLAGQLTQGDIPETRISQDQRITIAVTPFTLARHKLILPENGTYEIAVHSRAGQGAGGSSDPVKVSYRNAETTGHWTGSGGLPDFTITTRCGETKSFLFLATSTQADERQYSIDIEVKRKQERWANSNAGCCVNTGQHDRCVVGSWVVDSGFMAQQFHRKLPNIQFNNIQSNERVMYRADGTASGRIADRTSGSFVTGKGRTRIRADVSGQGNGTWSTRAGNLYVCPRHESSTNEREINWPTGQTEKGPLSFPEPQGVTLSYRCSGNMLEIELPTGTNIERYKLFKRYKRVQ